MTILHENRAVPLGSVAIFRFVSLAERMLDGFKAWRRSRRTRLELSRLSDDQLRDIGIERGQIASVAAPLH